MPVIPRPRRFPPWALGLGCTFMAMAPAFAWRAWAEDPEAWSPGRLAVLAWAIVWVMIGARIYLTRLDEVARSAVRWAWEWGGAIGLGLAMAAAVSVLQFPALAAQVAELSQSDRWPATSVAFLYGVLSAVAAAFLGYTVCLIGWWVAKR
jgi:hypothetical protein